jgi:RNA polymerase sigma-70 factor (ECF subfamily)
MAEVAVSALSDEEIVARVLGGSGAEASDGFEILMRRYNQRLYRVARSVFPRDASEAEDIVQDAWVRAFTHLEQFAGRARFSTWLVRIALHEAWARARRGRRLAPNPIEQHEEELPMPIDRENADPEREASDREMHVILEDAVEALPETYRTVFMLRAIEDMSTAEAAECLDLTPEAVKTRLHRARALLRREVLARAGAGEAALYPFAGERCDRIVAGVLARVARNRAPSPHPH